VSPTRSGEPKIKVSYSRRKKEEKRRKKEEGRRKKEEGRRKKEEEGHNIGFDCYIIWFRV
jgi:hypothetical protein